LDAGSDATAVCGSSMVDGRTVNRSVVASWRRSPLALRRQSPHPVAATEFCRILNCKGISP
jgi:hypothetical protein